MSDDIYVTFIDLCLFIPNSIPSAETQLMFKEATQKNYKISFDEYHTEIRVVSDIIVQADIGSAQQVSSPKCFISADQTLNRTGAADKKINIAIFDNLDHQNYYVETDSQR